MKPAPLLCSLALCICSAFVLTCSKSVDNESDDNGDGDEQSLTLISPNGGEVLKVGTNENITWASTGLMSGTKIECSYNDGNAWSVISSTTANDGHYSWTVPDVCSTACLIRISDAEDGNPSDISDGTFCIQAVGPTPGVWTATSGFGSFDFVVNSSATAISEINYHFSNWYCGGSSHSGNLRISTPSGWPIVSGEFEISNTLDIDGNEEMTIEGSFDQNGNEASGTFTAEMYGSTCSGTWSASLSEDGTSLTVLSPDGSENWEVGSDQIISWGSIGTIPNIAIDYSTDNGTTWSPVIASTPNDGDFSWNVPDTPSSGCLVRLSDALDGKPSDQSDQTFSIVSPVPTAPSLITPVNGSTTDDNTPTFSWSEPPEADHYWIKVDDDSTFSAPDIDQSSLNTNSFTPASGLDDDTYYWKVRASTGRRWGDWSNTWKFSIDSPDQVPEAPTLLNPVDGITITDDVVIFVWSEPDEAYRYQLQVDNNSGFTSPEIDRSNLSEGSFYAISVLDDGIYYWRVRAKNDSGEWGDWSEIRSFTIDLPQPAPEAPILISPPDNSMIDDQTPWLAWSSPTNAYRYELQVDNNGDFISPEISQSDLNSNEYTPTSALNDDTYFWRVRANNSDGVWGDWSNTWSFTIDTSAPAPEAPNLISPPNNSTINNETPQFDWSSPTNAYRYEIQVDDYDAFYTPEIEESELGSNNYTSTSALDEGTYYWRVRAKNSDGVWGNWSATWNFTVDVPDPAPEAPTLYSPDDGSTTGDRTPWINWSSPQNAIAYELEVDDNSIFLSPEIKESDLVDSDFWPETDLEYGTYYWRVRARNSDGVWSDWSSVWSFTIEDPGFQTGDWIATTEFGTLKFGVSSSGKSISGMSLHFSDWVCGIWVINGSVYFSDYWPISDKSFSITVEFDVTQSMTIEGTFDSTNRASGTFRHSVTSSSTCSGTWIATPEN